MAKKVNDVLDLHEVLRTAPGRRVIYRMLERMGYWSNSFNNDPYQQAKFAGLRDYAVELADTIEREFAEYWIMIIRERIEQRNPQPTKKDNEEEDDDNSSR